MPISGMWIWPVNAKRPRLVALGILNVTPDAIGREAVRRGQAPLRRKMGPKRTYSARGGESGPLQLHHRLVERGEEAGTIRLGEGRRAAGLADARAQVGHDRARRDGGADRIGG